MPTEDDHLHVPMRPVPSGRWGKTWLVAIAVAVALFIALELTVRSLGFQPSIKEDNYSWALERKRASDRSPKTVAVLGASRVLLAFSPSAFREHLPGYEYVQLAVQGTGPIGSLRDLALDTDFRGVAIVDLPEGAVWRVTWDTQDHVIAAYHQGWRSLGKLGERWLTTRVQSKIALLAGSGFQMLAGLAEGTRPKPRYTTTFADRTMFADYDFADLDRKRRVRLARVEQWLESPMNEDPSSWLAEALAQEIFVALIHARGGKVVYLRMPTCDERWIADEAKLPRRLFWDRLASVTQATPVHFADYPTLANFECPDTSHIDSKDGPRFTRALIDVLVDQQVLAR